MDNVKINEGIGNNTFHVATDEIANIHYPIYKVSYGADGEQIPVSEDNPLPIDFTTLISAQLSASLETNCLLNKIHKELKKMNLYNAMAHNQEVTNEDIE